MPKPFTLLILWPKLSDSEKSHLRIDLDRTHPKGSAAHKLFYENSIEAHHHTPINSRKDLHTYMEEQRPYWEDLRAEADRHNFDFKVEGEFISAKIILSKPGILVMNPGHEELDVRDLSPIHHKLVQEALRLFPKGLPHEVHELNEAQKTFLVTHKAAKTLLFLGEIDHIYPYRIAKPQHGYLFDEFTSQAQELAEKQTGTDIQIAVNLAGSQFSANLSDLGGKHMSTDSMRVLKTYSEMIEADISSTSNSSYKPDHPKNPFYLEHAHTAPHLRGGLPLHDSKREITGMPSTGLIGAATLAAAALVFCCLRRRGKAKAALVKGTEPKAS